MKCILVSVDEFAGTASPNSLSTALPLMPGIALLSIIFTSNSAVYIVCRKERESYTFFQARSFAPRLPRTSTTASKAASDCASVTACSPRETRVRRKAMLRSPVSPALGA